MHNTLNVAILGYGKMGKEIEAILLERGHSIPLKINKNNLKELTINNLDKCDVAIEFSTPSAAVHNIYACFKAGIPVVSGTTAWLNKLPEVKQEMLQNKGTLFYAPNYSIGVNLFFKINEIMAKLMNQNKQYNAEMEESHHTEKLDSPSGTAIHTAKILINELDKLEQWVEIPEQSSNDLGKAKASSQLNHKKGENELLIRVKREKDVPGTHIVRYLSEEDMLEFKHTAHSRKGFALGAVLAAEWVVGKQGFFEMKDMLTF